LGAAPDIGADERGQPPPAPVSDLRVAQAIAAGGSLTLTVTWTPPASALTTTLRYSSSLITEANWASAPLLAGGLPGQTEAYTASVPYAGGTRYVALRTQNAAGESALSNVVFWPAWRLWLAVLAR
jgi:hypothetical protein